MEVRAPAGRRRSGGLILRIAVAAGLTAYILWKSHPREVLAAAAGADWRWIGAAVLLVLVDRSLMAYRALVLLCVVDRDRRPTFGAMMRIFFVSTFLGTFLPATVGADAVRAYSLARLDVRGGEAVASVFMDRILGVASIFIMALAGLAAAPDLLGNAAILAALAVVAAACLVVLLLVFTDGAARAFARTTRWLPVSAGNAIGSVLESVRRYGSHHPALANVLASSIGVQLLRVVQAHYLGRGLHIQAPFTTYLAFIPLILLVMLLPVTLNGIGTSQAAFVWFFARAGVARAPAFALSVLFVALGVVGNLPGGVLWLTGKGEHGRSGGS